MLMRKLESNYRNLNNKKNVVIQNNKQPLILTLEYGNIIVTVLKSICNAYIFLRCVKSTVIQFASAGFIKSNLFSYS